jgi:hypothetical protein
LPNIRPCLLILVAAAIVVAPARAQKHELAFSLGGIPDQTRSFQSPATGKVQISSGRSFGINFARGLVHSDVAALYGEIEFVAIPNRSVTAANALVPQNYASLYLAPGLRLKLFPHRRLAPWIAAGGGYALYQQSEKLSNGQEAANRFVHRGVFDLGGGLDYRVLPLIGLRGEVRDFFSGNPNLGTSLGSSTQHNVAQAAVSFCSSDSRIMKTPTE